MMKNKVLTVMVCAAMLTASGSAVAAFAEDTSAPAFSFNQGGAPGGQMDFMGGQMSGMPGGQMNMDGQTLPSMPDFSGNQNTENTQNFQDMPDFSGGQFFDSAQQSQPSVPDTTVDQISSASQTQPAMPDFFGSQGQNTTDSQAPALPNNFTGENNTQMPPAFNNGQGGFMGGQNAPMGQPAEDDSRVIAKVTGIEGNTLTVETITFGEDGTQSTATSTYDISGIDMGEDIKTDSMVQINLNEDGSVSTVSADQGMSGGMQRGPQNGFQGQPAADSNHVIAKVTGIEGNTLTVETITFGEDGTQSTATSTYDISGIEMGQDIKTDSMVQISLNEDGSVSTVSADQGMPGGMQDGPQNGFQGQPAADSNHVVAKVTGIDGNTLTVEKLTPGEAGQQSSETVTYDISGITVGEDIKTDSMIEITLGEDGNVSSVSAGRDMPAGGSVPSMQMLSKASTSQIIEYFD